MPAEITKSSVINQIIEISTLKCIVVWERKQAKDVSDVNIKQLYIILHVLRKLCVNRINNSKIKIVY